MSRISIWLSDILFPTPSRMHTLLGCLGLNQFVCWALLLLTPGPPALPHRAPMAEGTHATESPATWAGGLSQLRSIARSLSPGILTTILTRSYPDHRTLI